MKISRYGIGLLTASAFKFVVTLLLGVEPDPCMAMITIAAGVVGAIIVLVSSDRGERKE